MQNKSNYKILFDVATEGNFAIEITEGQFAGVQVEVKEIGISEDDKLIYNYDILGYSDSSKDAVICEEFENLVGDITLGIIQEAFKNGQSENDNSENNIERIIEERNVL